MPRHRLPPDSFVMDPVQKRIHSNFSSFCLPVAGPSTLLLRDILSTYNRTIMTRHYLSRYTAMSGRGSEGVFGWALMYVRRRVTGSIANEPGLIYLERRCHIPKGSLLLVS